MPVIFASGMHWCGFPRVRSSLPSSVFDRNLYKTILEKKKKRKYENMFQKSKKKDPPCRKDVHYGDGDNPFNQRGAVETAALHQVKEMTFLATKI